MIARRIRTVITLTIVLALGTTPAPVAGADEDEFFDRSWEYVGDSRHGPSLGLAPGGVPWIAYVQPDAVVVAKRVAGSWLTVARLSAAGPIHLSFRLDGAGKAHLAYMESGAQDRVVYGTNRFGVWQRTAFVTGGRPALAVDPLGEVHLVFPRFGALAYATNRKGFWKLHRLPLVTGGSLGDPWPDLAPVGAATSDSAEAASTGSTLRPRLDPEVVLPTRTIPKRAGSATAVQPAAIQIDASARSGIGLDARNRIHVVYVRTDAPGIYYTTNSSGSWVTTRLTTSAGDGDPFVTATPAGKADIVYSQAGATVVHRTNASGSWVESTVASPAADPLDLIRTGDGSLHALLDMSDLDPFADDLVEAIRPAGGTWSLLHRAHLAEDSALAVDATGMSHIATGGSRVWYSHWGPSSSVRMRLDDNHMPALGHGPDGAVHAVTAQLGDSATDGLRKYVLSDSGWTGAVITTEADREPALAVDGAGASHVVFTRQILGEAGPRLWYATDASGSWVQTALTVAGEERPECPVIKLDAAGAVHIAYADHDSPWEITYRMNAGGTWRKKLAPASVWRCPSLHVTSDGIPHIAARYSSSPGAIRYITLPVFNGAWTNVRVSTLDGWPRITLDSGGTAHVTIATTGGLWYATNPGGTWVQQRLSTEGSSSNSLAAPILVRPDGGLSVLEPTEDWGLILYEGVGGTWRISRLTTHPFDAAPGAELDALGELDILFTRSVPGGVLFIHE